VTEGELLALLAHYREAVSPAAGFYDRIGRWDSGLATSEFNDWLADVYGLRAYRMAVSGPRRPSRDRRLGDVAVTHCVSHVDGWCVDFTYFQFDPNGESPRILPWHLLRREWASAENLDSADRHLHGWGTPAER
jgi:hypothetical protein